ncbi:MAG: hypothetical protein VZR56_05950 [Treponema sp.]|nr:hypothetical protein [Treponema sp.]
MKGCNCRFIFSKYEPVYHGDINNKPPSKTSQNDGGSFSVEMEDNSFKIEFHDGTSIDLNKAICFYDDDTKTLAFVEFCKTIKPNSKPALMGSIFYDVEVQYE